MKQPTSPECDGVCRGARLPMARGARAFGELAYPRHPHESMGQAWRAGSRLCRVARATDYSRSGRSRLAGEYGGERPPGWHGRSKKNGPPAIGNSRAGWTTKIHLVAADARTAVNVSLSPGHAGDAPEGREWLKQTKLAATSVIMDRAYEGDDTRQLVRDLACIPVVPPKRNRREPWEYDRHVYKQRNEVERLFRRLKGFRRIVSRFDKLDVVFTFFIYLALITDALTSVNTP